MTAAFASRCLAVALLAAFCGCNTVTVTQANVFQDEDGFSLRVEYGTLKRAHTTHFVSPNGREQDFESQLTVAVELPDGKSFRGYQCLNPLPQGTMYESGNRKYLYHASGFACRVYQLGEDGEYYTIFEGQLARIPGGSK